MSRTGAAALVWLLVAVAAGRAEEPWRKARALRPGDTIALVAPAYPIERKNVEAYVRRLEVAGFKVRVPENLFRKDHYLAGSDEERAAELNAAFRDPEVRAVFPCRGGYGLTRILDRLDYDALRKSPRIVTGYSDLTALHLAIAARARLITFHSPMMANPPAAGDDPARYSPALLWRTLLRDKGLGTNPDGYVVELPADRPRPDKLAGGRATGRLVGGNLTLVTATLGTPYAIEAKGTILLLEDTGEAAYRVDRMLSQLRLAGVLDQVAGVVLGTFDGTEPSDLDWVLRRTFEGAKVPVLRNFPVGHTAYNATLPHGALVELDADRGQLRVAEAPLSAD